MLSVIFLINNNLKTKIKENVQLYGHQLCLYKNQNQKYQIYVKLQ